ncbi:hypothetical protein ACT7C1_15265 [Bacillus paranthracis]|uniref:hypothetical protein n=1 Tax=Bacillus thuringiensis TaxID=1428 RepID=UPI00106622A6|nr:hypothetical protein [Bacillus thuringiensis]TEA80675.1 hypothetical protein PBMB05447_26240 [Bacillus thuringiensis F14-1]
MTANQMLEMIVEQSVEELDRYEEFQELYPHQNKFTLEEFNQFELAIYLKMSNIKKESYKEGFKQGINFILSMQK